MPTLVSSSTKVARKYSSDDARWAAVIGRDSDADGRFFYGVRTTGVFCRPSCPSRPPRRENVKFYLEAEQAIRGGFRPCKRCRPTEDSLEKRHAAAITSVCRHIETTETVPTLDELASRCGLSRFHFHRLFKRITGVTPRAYAAAHRSRRVRSGLAVDKRITDAIYDAGFNSSARFYEKSQQVLGMKPRAYRAGGAGESLRFGIGECSLGSILVAATERGIAAILIGDDPERLLRDLELAFPKARLIGGDRDFERWMAEVVGLVESPASKVELPLDIRGTAFQQKVWHALTKIPPGETATYSSVATRIGAPKAVRAVAQACAANTLAVAIPCHRVVRLNGDLSGYRWGVERKRALLKKEAQSSAQRQPP